MNILKNPKSFLLRQLAFLLGFSVMCLALVSSAFFIRDGKKYRREDEEQRQRMYSLKTVRKAAEKAGFSILCECADLDFSPLKEESERAFFICRLPFLKER